MIATDDHLAVLAHGAVTVSVTGAQDVSFSAAESLSWVERTIDRSFETLTVEGTPANVEGTPPPLSLPAMGPRPERFVSPLDLLAGTVPGGGATVRSRAPGPPPAKQGTEPAERGAAPPEQEVARVLERPAYLPAHGASVASARTGSTGTAAVRAAPEPGQPAPDHARASVAGSVEGATQGSAQGSAEGSAEGSAPGGAEGRTEGRTVMRPTVAVKRGPSGPRTASARGCGGRRCREGLWPRRAGERRPGRAGRGGDLPPRPLQRPGVGHLRALRGAARRGCPAGTRAAAAARCAGHRRRLGVHGDRGLRHRPRPGAGRRRQGRHGQAAGPAGRGAQHLAGPRAAGPSPAGGCWSGTAARPTARSSAAADRPGRGRRCRASRATPLRPGRPGAARQATAAVRLLPRAARRR